MDIKPPPAQPDRPPAHADHDPIVHAEHITRSRLPKSSKCTRLAHCRASAFPSSTTAGNIVSIFTLTLLAPTGTCRPPDVMHQWTH
eukprot:4319764-Amphidinium_carterae.1